MTQQMNPFHVEWDNPEDAQATWLFDRMHFPHPLPAVPSDVLSAMLREIFNGEPRVVNGYTFTKNYGPPMPPPEVIERGVVNIWTEDFVPRISDFCADVRKRDYDGLSLPDAAAAALDAVAASRDAFRYTMIVVLPFMGPGMHLVEFAEQVLGSDGPTLAGTLLQAFENETALAGGGLASLAESARRVPGLAAAAATGDLAKVKAVPGSAPFVQEFEKFLADYGWRVDDWTLLHVPTWAEDPRTPLQLIGQYASDPDRSPAASARRALEQREQARQEVESRLSGQALEEFRGMLAAAEAHVPMSEGRARWQLTIMGSLRVPFLALGRKLAAAGVIETANDVFYLSLDELPRLASHPTDMRQAVRDRKADLERFARLDPPPFLGAPPSMEGAPPELVAVFRRFFGIGVQPSADAGVIAGNAASRGTVRGRARIIRALSEANRLQPGEILVCETTSPPWTPLFAIAGGVVADTGGVLSHSAICAREYAIPCVVGAEGATSRIPDGAMIVVDGTAGTVRIEA